MRKKRSIRLTDTSSKPPKRRRYDWEKTVKLPEGYEKRWRRGKTLHVLRVVDYTFASGRGRRRTSTRERLNAVVQWHQLLASVKIEDDDRSEPPWEDCDGWDHETDRFSRECYHSGLRYSSRFVHHNGHGYIITINPAEMGLPDYEYYHSRGAAKQVARQLAAKAIREALRQLRKWYEDGWQYHGATCRFRTYEASCWGIDDYDYALKEVGPEMAGEVAHQLEADGYVIVGRPTVELHRGQSLESWQREFQRRLNMFNMEKRK